MFCRIMKNRRTAEESRLRRIQRIQELQNILIESQQREEKLNEEIVQLRQELAAQVAEVNRLRAALLRRQNK
jgi:N-glycosylase/DNA lyase